MRVSRVWKTLSLACLTIVFCGPLSHAEETPIGLTGFRPKLFGFGQQDTRAEDNKKHSGFQEPIYAPPSSRVQSSPPQAPVMADGKVDPLLQLAMKAIDKTQRRYMDANQHRPWQIIHGLVGLRRDLELRDRNRKVNAIEWLSSGPTFKGEHWFMVTEHGAKARGYNGTPYEFEGHVNQTLALLAMSNLSLEHQFRVAGGRTITMADLVNHAKLNVTTREEITWTLWFLTHYLDIDEEWTNVDGDPWSIEELVRLQTRASVVNAPCGGTHGLFAIAYARNAYLYKHGHLRGTYFDADQKIKRHIELARKLQNRDGSFSTEYFKGPGYSRDFNERLKSSGHMLEWLMMAMPHKQLSEPWVRRAVASVATDLVHNAHRPAETGPMYHAVHSLVLYRERMIHSLQKKTEVLAEQSKSPAELKSPAAEKRPTETVASIPDLAEKSRPRVSQVLKAPPVPEPAPLPVIAGSPVTTVDQTGPDDVDEDASVSDSEETNVAEAEPEDRVSRKAARRVVRNSRKIGRVTAPDGEAKFDNGDTDPALAGPSLPPVEVATEPKEDSKVR